MKIPVKVHPKARVEKVVEAGEGFEIWVREAPDKGRATEAAREALAEKLGVAKSRVSLAAGAASRNKIFEVR